MIGEYDLVKGLSAFLRSVGIDVKYKLCSHSLKSIVEPELDIQYISVEKEKIDILKKCRRHLFWQTMFHTGFVIAVMPY